MHDGLAARSIVRGAVHREQYVFHRRGLQKTKTSSCDPMVHAHPDPDQTVDVVPEFDKDSWARSDDPDSIHHMIQRLRTFSTLIRS